MNGETEKWTSRTRGADASASLKVLVERAHHDAMPYTEKGQLVNYIPGLECIDPHQLGIVVATPEGDEVAYGAYDVPFTMMSLVKIALYALALQHYEEKEVRARIGVKGSSRAYNSLADLELSEGRRPVNPFINAGALLSSALLLRAYAGDADVAYEAVRALVCRMAVNDTLTDQKELYENATRSGYANLALVFSLMKNHVLEDDVDPSAVLSLYNRSCCLLMNARDLAHFGMTLARGGVNAHGERVMSERQATLLRALMAICGTYNGAGEVAADIGLPMKSGVGGGIVAVTKSGYSIATYSPALDAEGNSAAGLEAMRILARELNLGIY